MPILFWLLLGLPCLSFALDAVQLKPLLIDKELMDRIIKLPVDTSNANTINGMIGSPAACFPTKPPPSEIWACQWKGNLKSSGLRNTVTISFTAGSLLSVIGIDDKGTYFIGEIGKPVQVIG